MGIILLNPKHKMVDIIAATKAVYEASGNKCPKSVTITLAGSAGTAWATDAIKKISTAILTDSDGYKMTIAFSKALTTIAVASKFEGGCVLATTGNAVCWRGKYGATADKWGLTYVPDCNVTNATTAVAACNKTSWGAVGSVITMGGNCGNPRRPRRRYTLACLDSLLKKLPSGTLLTLLLSTLPPLAALVKPSPVPPPSLPEPLSPLDLLPS